MWELDHTEGWTPKNWWFWIVVLEKILESPLDCKEIKAVNPKGNQPWIFIGRTDAEAEAPILWPPDVKSWLIRKDPDAGKDWRQEEKGTTEDEMVAWHHQLNGQEYEQALGDGEGQEAWNAVVHGVAKSWTRLSDWTTILRIGTIPFTQHFISQTKLQDQPQFKYGEKDYTSWCEELQSHVVKGCNPIWRGVG